MKEVIEYHDNGQIREKYQVDEDGMVHGFYGYGKDFLLDRSGI